MKENKIKKSRHSRVLLSGIFNACRSVLSYGKQQNVEDPRLQTSGMTPYFMKSRAFTLIELLVVVLIIGILAAIALPQYQKAVYKARATEAMLMLKAIHDAQNVYYLANGEYTNDMAELDVNIPENLVDETLSGKESKPQQYYYACWMKESCFAIASDQNLPAFEYQNGFKGKFWCQVNNSGNNLAKNICQSMGRIDTSKSWFAGKYFILN